MGKRKADAPPVLDLDLVHADQLVEPYDSPSTSTANCVGVNQEHVADPETSELHPLWLLLSQGGYEWW